jgi:hypothetical protein
MRTLEVAALDSKAGGGAMRAVIMVSLRRRIGVEDCKKPYRSTQNSTI